ncbi:MAG: hypothetical protein KC620_10080 [Myxococcales bacterium]|nr:hypothetical protein [Myxococcales bacterium]
MTALLEPTTPRPLGQHVASAGNVLPEGGAGATPSRSRLSALARWSLRTLGVAAAAAPTASCNDRPPIERTCRCNPEGNEVCVNGRCEPRVTVASNPIGPKPYILSPAEQLLVEAWRHPRMRAFAIAHLEGLVNWQDLAFARLRQRASRAGGSGAVAPDAS